MDQLLPYLYTIISGPENISRTKIQDVINELKLRISNYKEDNKLLIKADSVRQAQIKVYKDWNKSLTKDLNKKNRTLFFWKIGGIIVSSGLLVLLLVK